MMRSFSESKTIALAIGAESGNVLNGTRLSPVVGDGFISIWATADVDSVDMELLVQSDNVCKKFEISDANRYPVMDEDWAILNIPVGRTEVIELQFTNNNAAAASVKYKVSVSPRMNPNIGSGRRR